MNALDETMGTYEWAGDASTSLPVVRTFEGGSNMDDSTCSVAVCERLSRSPGGYCASHRHWSFMHGGAVPTHAIWPRGNAAEVLLRRVVLDEATGCHLWTGSTDQKGYGHLYHEGRLQPAHRVAWELTNGPIPDGLELDHVWARGCRSKACVNLAHLEPVTPAENMRRSWGVRVPQPRRSGRYAG